MACRAHTATLMQLADVNALPTKSRDPHARSARAAPLDARAGYHAAAQSQACRACCAPWPR
eukprot:scaffold70330_cov72-Phaeocystis_antarctica.AAC.2